MGINESDLRDDLDGLSSAEEFLDYFDVGFDTRVVQVNRLHILQRFQQYLKANPLSSGEDAYGHYAQWLTRAYNDFVGSSAQEQKALRVFQRGEPGFVSLDEFG